MRNAKAFSRFFLFWDSFDCQSPWGKDLKTACKIYTEKAEIEKKHDNIERILEWLNRIDAVKLDRLCWHMQRMPRIPQGKISETSDIFQIKKFLANYREFYGILDDGLKEFFLFEEIATGLVTELMKGGSDPETFFVSDSYSPELKATRARIRECMVEEKALKEIFHEEIRKETGLNFDGRDFLVVPRDTFYGVKIADGRLVVEVFDEKSFLIRPAMNSRMLELASRMEELLALEKEEEQHVIKRLSRLCTESMPEIVESTKKIMGFDIALLGALLAREYGMSRPVLVNESWEIENGCFLPCRNECNGMQLEYTPVDANFEKNVNVIFGSNMGGKTVLLQSIVFFQLLAQAGFFIPARLFKTRVFNNILYIGQDSENRKTGLSAFGHEIAGLDAAIKLSGKSLLVLDEFAGSTASDEAIALLSAIIEYFGEKADSGSIVFFASHYHSIKRSALASYYRMKGLDREAARAALGSDAMLEKRLLDINRNMRYKIIEDSDCSNRSDALAIAAMLGLDSGILEKAEDFLRGKEGRDENQTGSFKGKN